MHGAATGYVDDGERVVVRQSHRTTWQSVATELQKAEDSSTPCRGKLCSKTDRLCYAPMLLTGFIMLLRIVYYGSITPA